MKTMTQTKNQDKPQTTIIDIAPDETITIGIDVHKASFDCAIYSTTQRRIRKTWHMPADLNALIKIITPLSNSILRIGYEAGPTGFGLARFLLKHQLNTIVIAPSAIEQPPAPTAKSDRIDARKIAIYLDSPDQKSVYIPTVEEEDNRDTFRNRDQICRKIRRVKAQVKSHLLRWGIAQPDGLNHWSHQAINALADVPLPPNAHRMLMTYLDELEHLEKLLKEATAQMQTTVNEHHQRSASHCQSIAGVGPITASAFLLELPPMHHITNNCALSQLIGLAPMRRSSGQTTREAGRQPGGKPQLRSLLIEAAWRWQAQDPYAQAIFNRICRAIPSRRKKAITALARRLAIIMRRLILEDRPYQQRPAEA